MVRALKASGSAAHLLVAALPVLPRALAAVALFSGVASLLAWVPAVFAIQVYDRVLGSRSGATLAALLAVTLFALLVGAVLDAARQRLLVRLAGALDDSLAARVSAAGAAPPRAAVPPSLGSNPAERDLALLRNALGGAPAAALFDVPWLPLTLGALALLHPLLGTLGFAGVALAVAVMAAQAALQRRARREEQTLAAARSRDVEALAGAGAVWRCNGSVVPLLARSIARRFDWSARHTALAAGSHGWAAALRALKQAMQSALLAAGAWLVIGNEISAGVMIGSTLLFGRLLGPLEALQHGWRPLLEARDAARRLAALPAAPPLGDAGVAGVPVLRTAQATFGWPGSPRPMLKGVTLTLKPGETVAVTGRAASGKTTLARLLLGLVDPSLGQVLVDERGWAQRERHGDAPRRGWWASDAPPIVGTIAENIAPDGGEADDPDGAPVPASRAALATAAVAAGIAGWIEQLPAGYDTRVGPGAFEPSFHQARGLALARLLYARPQIAVVDEPGVLTDGETAAAMRRAIASLGAGGATVLIITGRRSWAALAPRWLLLDEGALVADGPAAAVAARLEAKA